jgi:hypothetical protein
MGMKYWLTRRDGTISFVMPSSSNRKCRLGSSNGELMTGFSMTTRGMVGATFRSGQAEGRSRER